VAPPGPVQPAADRDAAMFSVSIASPTSDAANDTGGVQAIRTAVTSAVTRAGPAAAGLRQAVTGAAALNADGSGGGSQSALILTAVIIVAVILLLVYRSPVLWLLPLFAAGGAIVLAEASAHGLASAGLTVSPLSGDILIVLVFGAASDYALLLVHRYREELRRHEHAEQAMAVALRRTMPTLVASAATVTCAMLCLLASSTAALHGLGPVGAVGIVAALLAETTFLPALLLVLGRTAFWPFRPIFSPSIGRNTGGSGGSSPGEILRPRHATQGRVESRFWSWAGSRVAARPVATALVMVVALGAACAGMATLRIDNNPVDNLKGTTGSLTGSQLVAAHFPAGTLQPLQILVPPSQASAAVTTARSVPGIGSVTTATPIGGYANLLAVQTADPYSPAGVASVVSLRDRLATAAPGALVTGNPAVYYDLAQALDRDNVVIMPLILLVVLIVIALLLQAVVAPVVLVLTTALSFGASFGLSNLLWHALGYSGTASTTPIFIFVFLVALGVDYNIFLAARIREESRTLGLRAGTLRGLGLTGGVLTAAGVVLAGTFAALAQIPQVGITEVGIAVALGVLIDTLLVRTVLVPAGLLSIGERVWWPSRRRFSAPEEAGANSVSSTAGGA
jgi:RND superfamily putative drug exporter